MAAPTTYFVDPSLGTNTGSGTIGDPWGSTGSVIERALDSLITRDATNGDKLCIKSGAYDVLTKDLDLTTYGTPSQDAQLTFEGYDSTEGDGGLGQVNLDATYRFGNNAYDYVNVFDLEIYNGASGKYMLDLDQTCFIKGCYIHTGVGGIEVNNYSKVIGCRLENLSGVGIDISSFSQALNNFVSCSNDIVKVNLSSVVARNILISTSSSTNGIEFNSHQDVAFNNSLLCTGSSTGAAIKNLSSTNSSNIIFDNLIEGWSGLGGDAIDLNTASRSVYMVANNSWYDCTNGIANDNGEILFQSDNESLGSSPFAKSGSLTYANRFTYFAPNDVGSVIGGAYGSGGRVDRGAVQSESSGGGGLFRPAGLNGGLSQ